MGAGILRDTFGSQVDIGLVAPYTKSVEELEERIYLALTRATAQRIRGISQPPVEVLGAIFHSFESVAESIVLHLMVARRAGFHVGSTPGEVKQAVEDLQYAMYVQFDHRCAEYRRRAQAVDETPETESSLASRGV